MQVKASGEGSERDVVAAAAELRTAVHELTTASISKAPDALRFRRAAELVNEAAALIDGEPLPRWWEGPATPPERLGLRAYKRRSLFQGELHLFSPSLSWKDFAGPEGEPGYGFSVSLPRVYEGPPDSVHGGYLAGLFDELLGAVQGLAAGGGGYTGRLEVRYRSLTPVETELVFNGWIVEDKGRRVNAVAQCWAGDLLCADARGLFVRPPT